MYPAVLGCHLGVTVDAVQMPVDASLVARVLFVTFHLHRFKLAISYSALLLLLTFRVAFIALNCDSLS